MKTNRKKITVFFLSIVLTAGFLSSSVYAAVVWSQQPDRVNGLNMMSTYGSDLGSILEADNFEFSGFVSQINPNPVMPVTDIHWWGGYDYGYNSPSQFRVSFWSNDSLASMPDTLLKDYYFSFAEVNEHLDSGDLYRYDVDITHNPFNAEFNTVYWISIAALNTFDWGWITSDKGWNEDAVQAWFEGNPLQGDKWTSNSSEIGTDMAFTLTSVPEPSTFLMLGIGLTGIFITRRKF